MVTDRKGNGSLHNFRDIDIDDIIGMTVVLQGRYEDHNMGLHINHWLHTLAQTEQLDAADLVDGTCMCGGSELLEATRPAGVLTPAAITIKCETAMCTEVECEANGIICPFCLGTNRLCNDDAMNGNMLTCAPVADCMKTTWVGGAELCMDCGEGVGDACAAVAALGLTPPVCPTSSILRRPACGIIQEVECPQPEFIKNHLY